ncbi:MAG TPA: DNRLRE domain-containing protein [Polyangiaceae bacterium]|nr:DNRLRE domain-containing protein [Polyangiaceae bacterium]
MTQHASLSRFRRRGGGIRSTRARSRACVLLGACAIGYVACSNTEPLETAARRQALSIAQSFQRGVSPDATYLGTADATLRQSAPGQNLGAAITCAVDGADRSGLDTSCLFYWDVSSIPPGSIIAEARISIRITRGSSNVYDIYELLRPWSENQTTWNIARIGSPWNAPGASAADDRGAWLGTITGATNTTQTVTLNEAGLARVRAWVEDPSSNAGLIVAHTTNSRELGMATGEHPTLAYRPTLSITYEPSSGGSSGGAPGAGGTSESGGTTSGSGGATAGTGGTTSGTGGSSGAGSLPGATEPELLVAFIGDQGANTNADAVLDLIKSEGAAAAIHNGDFDYANNPTAWDDRITRILGANYPYFALIGNHDAAAWGGANGYAAKIAARHARVPEMSCAGELGIKATCNFRGLYLIESCVGVTEFSTARCGKDSAEQVEFLHRALDLDSSLWSICNWHKNQRDMQVGTKSDEVGWEAYRECMLGGALVATGHEHSFSRTVTLTDVGNRGNSHGATGAFDLIQLAPGRNFVFTSGLGGTPVRPFDSTTHSEDTWWASYYTSDRWFKNGSLQAGTGTFGAFFIRFHVGGDPKRADAYFKDVNGRVADEFTIRVP